MEQFSIEGPPIADGGGRGRGGRFVAKEDPLFYLMSRFRDSYCLFAMRKEWAPGLFSEEAQYHYTTTPSVRPCLLLQRRL